MGLTTVHDPNDTFDSSAFTDLDSVGRIYEVGVNGVGYMLADNPEGDAELRYQRYTVPLEPDRFAVGTTPFAEAVEHYLFSGFDGWHGGAGQVFHDRPNSDQFRFYDSDNIDPFTNPGELRLLPTTQKSGDADASEAVLAVTANLRLYWRQNDTTVLGKAGIDAVPPVTFTTTEVNDLATDGQYCYIADATDIQRGKASLSVWVAIAAKKIDWVAGRMAIAEVASGSTPNQWDTLDETGAREAATPRLTLDSGWSIGNTVQGGGFLWFPASTDNHSVIYRWQPGTDNAPVVAWRAPEGLIIQSLFYYLGNLFIRASQDEDSTKFDAFIYRAPISPAGEPEPELIVEIEDAATDHSVGGWGADGRFVFFGWDVMDGTGAGVGCIDLSTGGYCKWVKTAVTGPVRSILRWHNELWFGIDGNGMYRTREENTKERRSQGYVITSITDKNSGLPKVWDSVNVQTDLIPTGGSAVVYGSQDHFDTWVQITDGSVNQNGIVGYEALWEKRAPGVAFKIEINRGDDHKISPSFRLLQAKLHPLGLADQVLILPINCADRISDLRGRELPESGPGTGDARARTLESLAQTRVVVQDIDFADTGASFVYEVVGTRVVRIGVLNRHQGKQQNQLVCVLTMRRRFDGTQGVPSSPAAASGGSLGVGLLGEMELGI